MGLVSPTPLVQNHCVFFLLKDPGTVHIYHYFLKYYRYCNGLISDNDDVHGYLVI